MSVLNKYNAAVESAVDTSDGTALRDLLVLSSKLGAHAMHEYITAGGACPSPSAGLWSSLPKIVAQRHTAAAAIAAHNFVDAYTYLHGCLTDYLTKVLPESSSWSLPLLDGLSSDLREVAAQADRQLVSEGVKAEKMDDCVRILTKAFQQISTDPSDPATSPDSKKTATLGCVNQLFRAYFSLNSLRLCANLTRYISAPSSPPFESTYPAAHRVTYNYYQGRLALFEDDLTLASTALTYALSRTPVAYISNRRRILLYLIPANLLRGTFPSSHTVSRYNMYWFAPIIAAIRGGNPASFDAAVVDHEQFFIRNGPYLVMEKLRPLVFRNLAHKLYRVRDVADADRHKIRLREFQISLAIRNTHMDADEVECVLANLIYTGLVKGYISHKVQYLVLSTKAPFPPIASTA